jgi:DNA-binding MarR family transcriptional regulator
LNLVHVKLNVMLTSEDVVSVAKQSGSSIMVGLLLHQAEVRATRTLNAALADLGITARHLGVMLLMRRDGVSTQKDLVARLISDKTAMVRLVDDLERLGCLTRTPSTRDRRMSHLRLTDEGVALFRTAERRAQRVVDDLFGVLSAEERVLLEGMLARIAGTAG